jgi:hypothetical protein
MQANATLEVCRTAEIDIPNDSTMFIIEAKTFAYGGGKTPQLTHHYSLLSTSFEKLLVALMATPPTSDTIKITEQVIDNYAVYDGMLISTGLVEYLPRPVPHIYKPHPVIIVRDTTTGSTRALLGNQSCDA